MKQTNLKTFIQTIIFAIVLFGGIWSMIGVHAATVHSGAVPRSEMTLIRELLSNEFDELNEKVDRLSREIVELRKSTVMTKDK